MASLLPIFIENFGDELVQNILIIIFGRIMDQQLNTLLFGEKTNLLISDLFETIRMGIHFNSFTLLLNIMVLQKNYEVNKYIEMYPPETIIQTIERNDIEIMEIILILIQKNKSYLDIVLNYLSDIVSLVYQRGAPLFNQTYASIYDMVSDFVIILAHQYFPYQSFSTLHGKNQQGLFDLILFSAQKASLHRINRLFSTYFILTEEEESESNLVMITDKLYLNVDSIYVESTTDDEGESHFELEEKELLQEDVIPEIVRDGPWFS